MRRFVLAVSLAHLVLLGGYVKLGAINPWQAVGSVFGGGYLWVVMLLSAASAPFLLGAVAWAIDAFLRRLANPWMKRVRELAFVMLGIGALLSLGNAILLADRRIEQNLRGLLVSFVNEHLLAVMVIVVFVGLVLFFISLGSTAIRVRLTRFLRATLYILAPSVLFSVAGVFYVLTFATPPERSKEASLPGNQPSLATGLPKSVVVLLFDAFSYGIVFSNGQVDQRLPNLRALAEQSLVFHNVPSFPGGTGRNVPIMLTGQIYAENAIRLDHQSREVTYLADGTEVVLKNQRNLFDLARDQGYRLVVFGYFLRYCSTYVKDKGYCQSTSADELNTEPRTFLQAFLEIYRLAVVKALPTFVGYKLESMLGTTFLSLIEDRTLGLHNALLTLLKDAKGSFIYAHYPVPHFPYVCFNPQTRRLQAAGATYFDSLQAVDFFLGEIRQTLQDSGLWDDTLLIVLADHHDPAATSDVRIPLIIKLPHMKQRVDFEGLWSHAQLLPLLEELFKHRSFDPSTVLTVVRALAPPEK